MRDLRPPPRTTWPRTPGGVFLGRDSEDNTWLCGGLLPCGVCPACRASLHLACEQPVLPGINHQGALATDIQLPSLAFLAPHPDVSPADMAAVASLVASAGPTYQAAVLWGMVPGDTVLLLGGVGPGALPLRVLLELGLRPVHMGDDLCAPMDGVTFISEGADLPPLPSSRLHLLDLCPSESSIGKWLHLLPRCISCSLLGPALPNAAGPPLTQLFAGQAAIRAIKEIHPHLLLDLAAMVLNGRLDITEDVQMMDLNHFAAAFTALSAGTVKRWPVMLSDLSA